MRLSINPNNPLELNSNSLSDSANKENMSMENGINDSCSLKAGAGAQEIVFDPSMFPVEGFNGDVHLNPYVRVLIFEHTTKVAIVSYETVNVPADIIACVKNIISAKANVSVNNVWIHATHAITTPHAPDNPIKRELFVKSMTEAAIAAADEAVATLRPAMIGVATGTLDVNSNRGIQIGENWYYGLNSNMPSNKKVTLVSFKGLDGNLIANVISYGIKPTAIDNVEMSTNTRKISSDVPGFACRMLEKDIGVPAMFYMPAAADQIPKETAMFYVPGTDKEANLIELSVAEGVEIVERLGTEMGKTIIELAKTVTYANEQQIVVAADTSFNWGNKNGDGEVSIDVRVITIGDNIAFVGLKPELNAVTEAQLWEASPFKHTLLLSFLDGDQKYMPDAEAHELHTWEWKRSGTARGSAEKFVEIAVDLLDGIKSGKIESNTSNRDSKITQIESSAKKTIEMAGYTWIVLGEKDGMALVVSRNVLEKRAYHPAGGSITWENSDIRKYLNGEFFEKTFSDEEKAKIAETTIENKSNSQYGVLGGNNTIDKVFLLSLNEAEKYMGDGIELLRGIDIDTNEITWWHLRSPGEANDVNASVNTIGLIDYHGVFDGVKDPSGGVRPAMWVYTSEELPNP